MEYAYIARVAIWSVFQNLATFMYACSYSTAQL